MRKCVFPDINSQTNNAKTNLPTPKKNSKINFLQDEAGPKLHERERESTVALLFRHHICNQS